MSEMDGNILDFKLVNHGTLMLLTPLSGAGRDWIEENVDEEQTWWGESLVVESGFADSIVYGIQADGLTIE